MVSALNYRMSMTDKLELLTLYNDTPTTELPGIIQVFFSFFSKTQLEHTPIFSCFIKTL